MLTVSKDDIPIEVFVLKRHHPNADTWLKSANAIKRGAKHFCATLAV